MPPVLEDVEAAADEAALAGRPEPVTVDVREVFQGIPAVRT